MNNIKYYIYARKSSEGNERQVSSIADQLHFLRKLANDLHLDVVNEFTESKSAKEPNRKQFNLMLQGIEDGKAQGILSWKLDRLSRNPIDSGKLQWLLQQGIVKHIKTIERDYFPKDNVLMMSVEMGMANQFIQDLRINTYRGMIRKAERGWFPGKAPIGYKSNPNKVKGEKEIIIDDEKFYLVRKMFELMLSGTCSVGEIHRVAVKEWNLKSSRKGLLSKSHLYRVLTNEFYIGRFEYPKGSKNFFDGKHTPMLTDEEFNKVQYLLGRRGVRRPKNKSFIYTGLIRCAECGAMITAEEKYRHQKNGVVRHYIYYHCTKRKDPNCSQKSIEEKELESQIKEEISKVTIPVEFTKWAIDILKEENEKENKERKELYNKCESDYKKCLSKLNDLLNMRLDRSVSDEEYVEKKSELENEKSRIKKLIDNFDSRVNDWMKNVEILFDFANTARTSFENGDLNTKRQILNFLGSNLTLLDRKLSISVEKPIIYLESLSSELKRVNSRNSRLEPRQRPYKTKTYRKQSPVSPELYPRRDSNT